MTEESREIAGRYRLIARIGGGAMGVVWQAKDIQLDRVVAVKELLMPFGQGEEKVTEAKNRAMREARIAARLQHHHAISVFNVVEDGDRPWLIMEYLPSKSLADVIKEDGARPVDEVIGIACQLASALTAAHEAGIVHRDVKPGNVLLGEDGTVKVTDFGISRAIGDVTLTATGEIAGTPAFLAPEVARGDEASFASDVFSLGATMYTAVEGKPPFGFGDNAIALLYRVSSGEIVPPTQAGKIESLMLRLLAMEPQERPTMKQALAELEAFGVDGGAIPTVRELPVPEPVAAVAASGGPSKKRLGVALIGVVVLAAIIAASLIAAHNAGSGVATPSPSQAPSSEVAATSAPVVPPVTSSPPLSTSPTSPSSPTTTSAPSGPAALEAAVKDYYALVAAKNLQASFAGLSDNFKRSHNNQTFETYSAFWNRFSAVVVSEVTAAGGNAVNANVAFTEKGATSTERHRYTLVEQNGKWLIDTQAMR
ncbi:MAG: eukaryotic-like serine/threonine-protein kinase [Actinomycetota bacterium]|nr:eukaryotic-like serine/threonine-protein kinase [Actinomycetota bacterium]